MAEKKANKGMEDGVDGDAVDAAEKWKSSIGAGSGSQHLGPFCGRARLPVDGGSGRRERAGREGGERCGDSRATRTPASGRAGAGPLVVILQGDRGSNYV